MTIGLMTTAREKNGRSDKELVECIYRSSDVVGERAKDGPRGEFVSFRRGIAEGQGVILAVGLLMMISFLFVEREYLGKLKFNRETFFSIS